MKLLNELVSVHRIDDDEFDKDTDSEQLDYMEPDQDECCPDCECDPCECDGEDNISDDMGKLDDDDMSGYYDEFDLPAEDDVYPSDEYDVENEEHGQSSYDLGYQAYADGRGQEANPFDKGSDEYAEWMTAWNDARDEQRGQDEYTDMSDVEADADTLANAGWGTDEDYGYYGDENEEDKKPTEDMYERGYRDGFKRKPMASRDQEYRLGYEDGRNELEGGHAEDEETDPFSQDPFFQGEEAFHSGRDETDCPYEDGSDEANEWKQGFQNAEEESDHYTRQRDWRGDEDCEDVYKLSNYNFEDEDESTQRIRFVIKDVSSGNYIMTVRTDMSTMDPKVWWTKNPANAGKVTSAEQGDKDIAYLMKAVPGIEGRELKVVKVAVPSVSAYEVEDEETDTKRHDMRNLRKCPMCGMQHGLFSQCPMHGEEDEDEDMIRGQMGAYGQQGAHMQGAKDTDTMKTDYDPDAADELDLGDETGDNEPEMDDAEGKKLDALAGQATEDPDKQGVIRTVKGAHLIYKRQTEDGTYEELWIYNSGNMRDELTVRKAILAGTDIPTSKTASPDGSQQYELWSSGNAEMLQIKGLPN